MSPYEAIVEAIKELNKFYTETGDLTIELYYEQLESLHQSLLNLTKNEIKNDRI